MSQLKVLVVCCAVCFFMACQDDGGVTGPGDQKPQVGLRLQSESETISVGDDVDVEIRVEGVSDLFVLSFDVLFDPSVLEVRSLDHADSGTLDPERSLWTWSSIDGGVSIGAGLVQGANVGNVIGDGVLLVLTLRGLETGDSDLHVENVHLFDKRGERLEVGPRFESTVATVTVE